MKLNITSGKIARAQKTVIYGPEGIGKTTLAAAFPDPLFIDTEGGSAHLDVKRVDKPKDWEELLAIITEVANTPGVCRTLVIDTADWAEQMAIEYVLRTYQQKSIESFGYGKGYTYVGEEFARFLSTCDLCIRMGVNIVITAHAKMRKFEQPDEMGAYDRWEMKLSRQSAPLLKEWCDHLLFCNYQTDVIHMDNGSVKARGGKRVIYTAHHPAWDAKSRASLPEVVDMSFESVKSIYEVETPLDKAYKLLGATKYSEAELMAYIHDKGHADTAEYLSEIPTAFLKGWVLAHWDKIIEEMNSKEAN